ncbi:MAG: cytochrome c [Gammaproteobacteria bacterium]|nr:cytochrome c [Gammaproteobacteria bacterium]NNL49574.1 cytochrome c [Woeseiaceae bacterium]
MITTSAKRPLTTLTISALLVLAFSAISHADLAGRAIYERNCATCHGASGHPDASSPVVKALGVVPADFTDPLFNSREPGDDWKMVIKYGGAAMGLAAQMPAHEAALSDADIEAVTRYIKSMVDTRAYPPGEMNLFLPIRTKKAFPEDEVVYRGSFTDEDGDNARKHVLEFEKRVGKAGQVILELVHKSEGDVSELAEAEVGYKHALSFSNSHILSAAAVWAIPVEAEGDGELQTYLAYGKVLSDSWIFQSSLRLKFPFEGASDGEAELAGVVHWTHSPWPRRVYPALEMTATSPFRSGNGDVEWTALPQVRIGLTRGGHVALNLGIEMPLSDQAWDKRIYATLLWDFADGSFFQGW